MTEKRRFITIISIYWMFVCLTTLLSVVKVIHNKASPLLRRLVAALSPLRSQASLCNTTYLWWLYWQWDKLFSKLFGLSLSLSFHQWPIHISSIFTDATYFQQLTASLNNTLKYYYEGTFIYRQCRPIIQVYSSISTTPQKRFGTQVF